VGTAASKRDDLTTRSVALRLLQCVSALHDKGLVHADLKPKHFMRFDGDWKLIDFDNVLEDQTDCMPTCTVRYAAPEVAISRHTNSKVLVTMAVDVWACALILFELFSGSPLLDDETSLSMLAHQGDEVVSRLKRKAGLADSQRRLLLEMLKVDPAERSSLRDVLSKGYFKTGEDTEEAKHVEVLALFSSPSKSTKLSARAVTIPPLQLMREVATLQDGIPRRLREIRPAARFPDDIEEIVKGVRPRVIQFSGHGDIVKKDNATRGLFTGALAFEVDGELQLPDPKLFIDLLDPAICPRLECVFLNACNSIHPLGEKIVDALPHLTVIGWSSILEDKAAIAFSTGFYNALGRGLDSGGGKVSITEAYREAEAEFKKANKKRGDPRVQGTAVHGNYVMLKSKDKDWHSRQLRPFRETSPNDADAVEHDRGMPLAARRQTSGRPEQGEERERKGVLPLSAGTHEDRVHEEQRQKVDAAKQVNWRAAPYPCSPLRQSSKPAKLATRASSIPVFNEDDHTAAKHHLASARCPSAKGPS